jgi:hypothetical protein
MVPIHCSIIVARSSPELHCRLASVLAEHRHQLISATQIFTEVLAILRMASTMRR